MLSGLVLLVAGFLGAAIEDWKTTNVHDAWNLLIGPGAVLTAYPFHFLNVGLALFLGSYGWYMAHEGKLGSGDFLPMGFAALVLGVWTVPMLGVVLSGMVVRKQKQGPGLPWLALGLLVSYPLMLLL